MAELQGYTPTGEQWSGGRKIYQDQNGQHYVYHGNGNWQPIRGLKGQFQKYSVKNYQTQPQNTTKGKSVSNNKGKSTTKSKNTSLKDRKGKSKQKVTPAQKAQQQGFVGDLFG